MISSTSLGVGNDADDGEAVHPMWEKGSPIHLVWRIFEISGITIPRLMETSGEIWLFNGCILFSIPPEFSPHQSVAQCSIFQNLFVSHSFGNILANNRWTFDVSLKDL